MTWSAALHFLTSASAVPSGPRSAVISAFPSVLAVRSPLHPSSGDETSSLPAPGTTSKSANNDRRCTEIDLIIPLQLLAADTLNAASLLLY